MQFNSKVKQTLVNYFNDASENGATFLNHENQTLPLMTCGVTFFQMLAREPLSFYKRQAIDIRVLELAHQWSNGTHRVADGVISVDNDKDKVKAFHKYLNDVFSNPFKYTT